MGRKMNFFLSSLLVLVFGMGLSTCSYASLTEEYIYYGLENGNFEGVNTSSVSITGYENLKDNIDIPFLIDLIETDCKNLGYEDIHDYNISCNFNSRNGSYYFISFFFSNNSRNTYDNLGYLKIDVDSSSNTNFYSYNEEPVYLFTYYYDTSYKYINKDISTIRNSPGISIGNYNNNKIYIVEDIQDLSIFNQNIITTTSWSEYFINYPRSSSNFYSARLKSNNSWFEMVNDNPIAPDEPENPEEPGGSGTTGTITNPSGDATGKVDLSGIQSGIGNINQNIDKTNEKLDGISGEIGKLNENLTTVPTLSGENITSSEITDALDFEFAEDPYANFWLELTTRTFWCFN